MAENTYQLEFINTDSDLQSIATALRDGDGARFCIYGPPGTGKTCFGHWLSSELGRPLVARKASDLLGPYVGMTEEKIDGAFREAERDSAILLLDEVDSFLADRSGARTSWEVTAVNQMLTCIESYTGILVASTNRLGALDHASLRRFDCKIFFDYLRGEQVAELLSYHCSRLQLPSPEPAELKLATRVKECTPGDFVTVSRRHRFAPFTHARGILKAVSEEISVRASAPFIGFVPQ